MSNAKSRNRPLRTILSKAIRWLHRSLPPISPDATAMGRPGRKIFLHGHTILIERPRAKTRG
ncbi:hypothetical protein [Pelagicoccus sp. SDUM812003]|uniref:hypothetical protein n=1 Tax=Pelagicoccus sp. SDUM812003 TaxID=3041267 RepID=UPI0028101853|nr:hypothetical protein [Pelagicoccus sp. SDUM812003]MDQ8205260.1 hypothetical protein [Pelagicoccus sp. SDUM812003]